ncbi:MAG: hypothetical protein EXR72_02540 [Myxococcales bacterium]|nr:hypothetical protein [Myxococcales bacterium]
MRAPGDLAAHAAVVFRASPRLSLVGPGGTTELALPGRIVCDDYLFLRECLRADAGIGLLPSFLGDPDVAEGRLARVLPRHRARLGASIHIVFPSPRNLPRKVTAFRDFLVDALKTRPLGARAG